MNFYWRFSLIPSLSSFTIVVLNSLQISLLRLKMDTNVFVSVMWSTSPISCKGRSSKSDYIYWDLVTKLIIRDSIVKINKLGQNWNILYSLKIHSAITLIYSFESHVSLFLFFYVSLFSVNTVDAASQQWKKTHVSVSEMSSKQVSEMESLIK